MYHFPAPPAPDKAPAPFTIRILDPDEIYGDRFVPKGVSHRSIRDAQTISDGLHKHNITLTHTTPTLIHAPTGFGKSYFILHELLPQAQERGEKILLVSNRIAISVQQKLEVMDILEDPRRGDLSDQGIRNTEDFGCIYIMTIQSLTEFFGVEYADFIRSFDTIVVDECHFFTSDSLFNPSCNYLLDMIPNKFAHAVRIYLTATPQDVLCPLFEAEEKADILLSNLLHNVYHPFAPVSKCFQYLTFPAADYSPVDLFYFRELTTLFERIRTTPPQEKWLIFVSAKTQGEDFAHALGNDVTVLTADKKDTLAWTTLLSTAKLPSHILVTTTVLDCGVNIHDDSLRHVVILLDDQVSFLQALGRKRRKEGEGFSLYVQRMEPARLAGLEHKNRTLLNTVNDIETANPSDNILAKLWNNGTPEERTLAHPCRNGHLLLNEVGAHKLKRQRYFYAQLRVGMEGYGDSAFPRIVHRWVGQEDGYDETHWLEYNGQQEARTQLHAFLSEHLNRPLVSEEEKDAFRSTLVAYHERLTNGKRRSDRKDTLKYTALSNMLGELGVPYVVAALDKNWVLNEKPLPREEDISDDG